MGREDPPEKGIDRRTLLKLGLAAAAGAVAGTGAYIAINSLRPVSPPLQVRETFVYTAPQGTSWLPIWYVDEGLVGQEARLSHFVPGRGAGVRWRTQFQEGGEELFPGFPALLMKVEEEQLEFPEQYPREEFVVDGLYAVFNTCTHAGCPASYKLISRTQYVTPDPGFDSIYCLCHDAQFHPRKIVVNTHPPPPEASGATYIGVEKISAPGPLDWAMPLIPIEIRGDRIIGHLQNPDWYQYLTWQGFPILHSTPRI